jgi:hypothetical protein
MRKLRTTPVMEFSSVLAPVELEQILRQIDENLAHSELLGKPDAAYGESGDIGAPPTMPEVAELAGRLENLRYMRAPIFVIKGRDWRNQLKRLMNLPIRVLSFKQISFNQQLLDLLDLMQAPIQRLPRHAEYQARIGRALARQQQQVASLQEIVESLVDQIGRQQATIEQQQQTLRELREAVAQLGEPRPPNHEQDTGQ